MSVLLLAYISDASRSFNESEMDEMLHTFRENNAKIDVTGILLYAGNKFLQILEGDFDKVHELYEKIAADPRHENAVVMDTQLMEGRHFSSWSMGYQRTEAKDIARELEGYIQVCEKGDLVIDHQPIKQLTINVLLNAFKKIVDSRKMTV